MWSRTTALLALSATWLTVLAACGGLPENFELLPLEKQVTAYARHLASGGRPLVEARSHISFHGWTAADVMATYAAGDSPGFPPHEAVQIIDRIQLRGCDLAGTKAEAAIVRYLDRSASNPADASVARTVLTAIRERRKFEPGELDGLRGGPCEQ